MQYGPSHPLDCPDAHFEEYDDEPGSCDHEGDDDEGWFEVRYVIPILILVAIFGIVAAFVMSRGG